MKLNYVVLLILIASFSGNRLYAQFTVDLTASPQFGCVPLAVQFTTTSLPADNITYEWTLGNGVVVGNNVSNPSTTYYTAGTYAVTLKATRNGQSITKLMYIRVFNNPVANFSTDITKGCIDVTSNPHKCTVNFTDLSVNGDTTIQSWLWSYKGTGESSSIRQGPYDYKYSGEYDVTFTVIDNHGCTGSITKTKAVDIADPPQVYFSTYPEQPCKVPASVKFTNSSIVKGRPSYLWNGGGTLVSTKKDTTFILSKYDTTYTINLTVTDLDYQCSSENYTNITIPRTKAIGVIKQGTKTINTTGDIVCAGLVNFSSTSLPSSNLPHWNIDNGAYEIWATTGQYAFDQPGNHTIKLDVSSSGDCSDSIRWNFFVDKVIPQFTQSPDISCQSPTSVTFTNTSSVNAASFLWKFADTTQSSSNNTIILHPYHVPNDANDYTIHNAFIFDTKLIATTINNCSDSVTHPFIIKRPTALFSVDTTSGCAPLLVNFTDKSLSDSTITSRDWDFGDGNTSHQTTQTIINHTYTIAGIYNAKLTITNKNGCTDASYTIPIKIGTLPNSPSFSVSPSNPCQNDVVTITDLTPASEKVDYWQYKINGIPIPACSDVKSPSFKFKPAVGTLTITQTVSYNGCSTSSATPQTITNKGPIAAFTYDVDCSTPHNYTFTNSSTGATSYTWKFGDATSTSSLLTLPHTFIATPANINDTVRLIATGSGCTDTATQIVYVREKIVQFTTPKPYGCANQPVAFTAAGSQPGSTLCQDKYIWNFNDSTPIIRTDLDPFNHTFKDRGNYKVLLSAIHDNGCTDTIAHRLQIYKPTSILTTNKVGGCPGTKITFYANSMADPGNSIKSLYMNFADMENDITSNNVSSNTYYYTFNASIDYSPYLKVTDDKLCTDSTIVSVGIYQPQAVLIPSDYTTQTCVDKTITFYLGLNAFEPDSMKWNFGDGTTSKLNVRSMDHVFTNEGTFKTQNIVYKYGCTDTARLAMETQKADASFTMSKTLLLCRDTVKLVHLFPTKYITSGDWNTGEKIIPYDTSQHTVNFINNLYSNSGTFATQLSITTSFGCTDFKTDTIKVLIPRAKFVVSPKQACVRDSITFAMQDAINVGNFQWDFGDGNSDKTGLHPIKKHAYDSIGKKYVYLRIYNSNNCESLIQDSITLDGVFAKFMVKDTAGCDKEPVVFTNLSKGQTEQLWNFSDGLAVPDVNPEHTFVPGTYPITLSISNANGCRDTARKTLTIAMSPDIQLSMGACANKKAQLLAVITNGTSVRWWPKQGLSDSTILNPIATPVGSVYYKAMVTNANGGCTKTDSIRIIRPRATVTPVWDSIYVGESLQIQVTDTSSVKDFFWTPTTGLSCDKCLNPIANPLESTAYYLVLTEPGNCFTDSLRVSVLLEYAKLEFSAPGAFRPADENYGLYKIFSEGFMDLLEFKIYNRWGNLVFTSNDGMVPYTNKEGQPKGFASKEGWDGKYQGKDQPIDTYIWVATAKMYSKEGSMIVKKKGSLILLR